MPSRTVTLLIMVGWLASAAWFVLREIAPLFRTGEPPPFTIELADEALHNEVPIRWKVWHDGVHAGSVKTAVFYNDADDTFAINSEISQLEIAQVALAKIEVTDFHNQYRVTRSGELLGVNTDGKLALIVAGGVDRVTIQAELTAKVHDGRIERFCKIVLPFGEVLTPHLESVELVRGSVLNPMHPVNRIAGLRPGRQWNMPLIDPMADASRAALEATLAKFVGNSVPLPFVASVSPRSIHAEVSEPQILQWDGADQSCLVIEYRSDDFTARTWVRRHDGLVLRQEARGAGQEWVLERD